MYDAGDNNNNWWLYSKIGNFFTWIKIENFKNISSWYVQYYAVKIKYSDIIVIYSRKKKNWQVIFQWNAFWEPVSNYYIKYVQLLLLTVNSN